MSFFQKALASIGIGSAKVDTVLHQHILSHGNLVEGEIVIKGGNVAQTIDNIYLRLHATYEKESNDRTYTESCVIDSFLVGESLEIGANEQKTIPFSFPLSIYTPFTLGKTKVWISTGLDIKNAIDPSDQDYVEVQPNALVNKLLSAVSELGFQMKQVECKESSYKRNGIPFVQELEYVPVSGSFYGKLDEIELSFLTVDDKLIELVVQVDKKARGLGGLFAEALDLDERFINVTIKDEEKNIIKQQLFNMVQTYS
ncbi:sporulation protein [Niallia nealsonii]|uniref:Sporulation protein SpoOM n=1 Tax=Niallia nealsonii TaxID=115979 RepID=A0A2N0Z3G5_9BACI|nr:sporulation protein [Niallia nealsonii]PKG24019.1 sporulation protein SpoOM [Niallia nealsonii]